MRSDGQSMSIKNWRVSFIFKDGDVFDVNYIDYH